MTTRERIANRLITEAVADYRASHVSRRALGPDAEGSNANGNAARAFTMQMDRAAGALDALNELFPRLPAWTDTKWIH